MNSMLMNPCTTMEQAQKDHTRTETANIFSEIAKRNIVKPDPLFIGCDMFINIKARFILGCD